MERQTVRGHHRIMGESDVRQRDGRSRRAGGSASDLVASKLRRPLIRPGTVCRASLIERLARGGPRPVVSVVAPAGDGKTTLLSQWAERDGQAFAWVSVDEADNDAKVLLSYVAEVLDAVEPIDERVFDALASPASSVPGSVVPRLGRAFSSMTSPVVLVLDDVHVLRNSECRAALSVLADHVPAGSRLALAGRAQPPLRIARLRAEGKILEIGPDDLSLTQMEVYAGYSENADHNVGRVIDAIDELGELDNTVIIWIWGDNGASMEGTITGSFNEMTMQNGIPLTDEMQLQLAERYGGIGAWGGQMMDPHYSAAWAWAGNTPFQWGKQVGSHLGGTRNPMVVHWPARIAEGGALRSQFTHAIDVGPTILDVAGIPAPSQVDGVEQEPFHGVTFADSLTDAAAPEHRTQQYFETMGNRAMYSAAGGWPSRPRASRG